MSGINMDGQNFSVRLTTDPIGGGDDDRSFLGVSDEGNNSIVIDGTMPETRQEEVLLHEIIHMVDDGLPEFMVRNLSVRLYGVLRDNGLLVDDLIGLVSDGSVTPEEMSRLNKKSEELKEEQSAGMFRVSETAWDKPVFTESGALTVEENTGVVNRNAVHEAVSRLLGAYGGIDAPRGKRPNNWQRMTARNLVDLYRDVLKEPVPSSLTEMTR